MSGPRPGEHGVWVPRSRLAALSAVLTSLVALAVIGYAYTNYAIGQSKRVELQNDRNWCELLVTLDSAYSAAPPASETGRKVASAIHDLRRKLGCV